MELSYTGYDLATKMPFNAWLTGNWWKSSVDSNDSICEIFWLPNWDCKIVSVGDFFHMRCITHVLNIGWLMILCTRLESIKYVIVAAYCHISFHLTNTSCKDEKLKGKKNLDVSFFSLNQIFPYVYED